ELRLLNEELSSFNYSVSHDLQAPLRRITGFSDLIDEEFGVGLPPALRLYIDKITTNSNLMKQIVNALLDLSRVSQKQLACDQVDLSALANSVLGDLKPDYEGRAISFEIDPDMHAFCDQQLAKILLNNVLGNAIKYTEHAADSKIEIGRCAHEDGYDAFFVSDNGIGFDNVYKNEIFKPFKRLHTEREYPGTGVGLATAERIMLRHRGKIWAEGIEGKGATFYFCFPNLSAC
ncbi:MAG: ATP-binding protein, partial [Spirochaetia bacterium]|nr:ATP-binding protein [Spirochaetia bacterium]